MKTIINATLKCHCICVKQEVIYIGMFQQALNTLVMYNHLERTSDDIKTLWKFCLFK